MVWYGDLSSIRTITSFPSTASTAASAFISYGQTVALTVSILHGGDRYHLCSLVRNNKSNIGRRFIGLPTRMSSSSSSSDRDSTTTLPLTRNLVVDRFCHRQFAKKTTSHGYAGIVLSLPISEFEGVVNSRYDPSKLVDGYAPFCKHLFVVNDFTDARVNVLTITDVNTRHIRTRYEARTEEELPVLARYFDRASLLEGMEEDEVFPVAKYLDLILYSREQIEKENAAMGKPKGEETETALWGIVSIKAQDVDYELPMTPITVMRNALGKEQGGSGVELSREAYMEAVGYWKDHANVL